jgi:hypothetical protein
MSRHTPANFVFTTLVLAVLIALPSLADAQSLPSLVPDQTSHAGGAQQISANPVGLLFDLFNFDYERRATDSVSIGVGGSTSTTEVYEYDGFYNESSHRERYLNGDVYVRFYPSGTALNGLAFGVKIGLTQVPDQGSYFGYGFDVNKSRIFRNHFYFGYGAGLKRLVGVDKGNFDLEYIPTLRLNVGFGF